MTERKMGSYERWNKRLYDSAESEAIDRLIDVINQQFPEQKPHRVRHMAERLLFCKRLGQTQYHKGAKDKHALKKFRRQIEKSVDALQSISPYTADTVALALYNYSSVPEDEDMFERLSWIARDLRLATQQAEKMLEAGSTMGQKNWAAINVVQVARHCWKLLSGKEAPDFLNEASPFARFLEEIFDAIHVGADPRAAMDAWRANREKLFPEDQTS